MDNKTTIEQRVNELGFELGNFNKKINSLSKAAAKDIMVNLDQEWSTFKVKHRGKDMIIEIGTVDQEKDLDLKTIAEFKDQYGENTYFEKFEEE